MMIMVRVGIVDMIMIQCRVGVSSKFVNGFWLYVGRVQFSMLVMVLDTSNGNIEREVFVRIIAYEISW